MNFPAALQLLDEGILRHARGAPPALLPMFFGATVVGGGWALFALLPFAWHRSTRRSTLWLLAAVTATSSVVSVLKAIFARVRPCDALAWSAPIAIASPGGGSFPSGHAAGSFAFAAFVSLRAPRFGPGVVVYAAVVAWSRCVLGVHYPSDVVAGAMLGTLMGAIFARVSRRSFGIKPPVGSGAAAGSEAAGSREAAREGEQDRSP